MAKLAGRRRVAWWKWALGGFFGLALLGAVLPEPPAAESAVSVAPTAQTSPPPQEASAIDGAEFMVNCIQQISAALKVPESAQFAPAEEVAANPPLFGPENAVWNSWVEAETRLGAYEKLSFTCTYTKADRKLRWQLTPVTQ